MSIAPVYSILSADAATTAIVGAGANARIYVAEIPEAEGQPVNALIPCITWRGVGGSPENVMDDRPSVDGRRVQIECWAMTAAAAMNLANVVRNALELVGNCVSLTGEDKDTETRRFRCYFDFYFLVPR